MGGSKEHAAGAGLEKAAGRLACAGRNSRRLTGEQVEQIHLVKGIPRLPLALEDQQIAIGMEVALATALALEDELARIGDEARFIRRIIGKSGSGDEAGEEEEDETAHGEVLDAKRAGMFDVEPAMGRGAIRMTSALLGKQGGCPTFIPKIPISYESHDLSNGLQPLLHPHHRRSARVRRAV